MSKASFSQYNYSSSVAGVVLGQTFEICKAGLKSVARHPKKTITRFGDACLETFENYVNLGQELKTLHRNPKFHLIRVIKDQRSGAPPRMQLVCPAKDEGILYDLEVKGMGYYCISHRWGEPEELISWTSNILDFDGRPMQVKIRGTKIGKLLSLLNEHDGYWWIDLFCNRSNNSDPPIEIMSDIYRHCNQCIALIECPDWAMDTVATRLSEPWSKFESLLMLGKRNKLEKRYADYASRVGTGVRLGDLVRIFIEIFQSRPDDIFAEALTAILESPWYSRVWTLQEAMLPRSMKLVGETSKTNRRVEYQHIALIAETIYNASVEAAKSMANGARSTFYINNFNIPAIDRARQFGKRFKLSNVCRGDAHYPYLLLALSLTKRKCGKKQDYVFGVLGILDIRIPYSNDPKVVWKTFLREMEKRLPKQSELPWEFDLARATNLAQVFASFQPRKLLERSKHYKYLKHVYSVPEDTMHEQYWN
ncbi:hypothetical protein BX666DRAFT_1618979 [Dichotomocladium elegans]|nr:hypothetical protein BX666DRAFT_1618979 [Dichotomocladium elegans]